MRIIDLHRRLLCWVLGLSLCAGVLDAAPPNEDRRDRRLQPDLVMDSVGIKPGLVIGDAGAGSGYFTVRLARRVGPDGFVYANDISEEALGNLDKRCEEEGLANIATILGEVDDPLFPERALDMVFMVYALHDFESPVAFLENLKSSLKPKATVVILDQDPEASGDDHFLTRAEVLRLFTAAGYELVRSEEFLAEDLLLIFRPTN